MSRAFRKRIENYQILGKEILIITKMIIGVETTENKAIARVFE